MQRAIGLLGSSTLPPDEGLWLKPCKSIHTFFMRYPIDVLFLDSEGTIVHQESLVPWRISRWVSRAEGVLEVAAGTLGKTQTQPGQRIILTPSPLVGEGGDGGRPPTSVLPHQGGGGS